MTVTDILAAASIGSALVSAGLAGYAVSQARRAMRLARSIRGWDLASRGAPRTFPTHLFDLKDLKPLRETPPADGAARG